MLRFRPTEGRPLLQSVAKVCAGTVGRGPGLRQRADCLPLLYCKALVSAALATLVLARSKGVASELRAAASRLRGAPLRILCIGLGGGSVPSLLADVLPNSLVDVAELEPVVVRAACEAMGFVEGPRLRVAVDEGGAFALRAAEAAGADTSDPEAGAYDAVVVDAYLATGELPEPLASPDGDLARALGLGLLRRRGGVLVLNLLRRLDPAPVLAAHVGAVRGGRQGATATGLFLQEPGRTLDGGPAEGTGNFILLLTTGALEVGSLEELRRLLVGAGEAAQAELRCPFDVALLAGGSDETWPFG